MHELIARVHEGHTVIGNSDLGFLQWKKIEYAAAKQANKGSHLKIEKSRRSKGEVIGEVVEHTVRCQRKNAVLLLDNKG